MTNSIARVLAPHHIEQLSIGSGWHSQTIEPSGCYTIDPDAAATIVKHNGIECDSLAFPHTMHFEDGAWTERGVSDAYTRLRPDEPRVDAEGRVRKYEAPKGEGTRIYLPAFAIDGGLDKFIDPGQPLVITEGEKKAVASTCRGIPCVSIPGVANGVIKNPNRGKYRRYTLRPDLASLVSEGRHVTIWFDSDAGKNRHVMAAQAALAQALTAAGAHVSVAFHPEEYGKGLDDFALACARHGTVFSDFWCQVVVPQGEVESRAAGTKSYWFTEKSAPVQLAKYGSWIDAKNNLRKRDDLIDVTEWAATFAAARSAALERIRAKNDKFVGIDLSPLQVELGLRGIALAPSDATDDRPWPIIIDEIGRRVHRFGDASELPAGTEDLLTCEEYDVASKIIGGDAEEPWSWYREQPCVYSDGVWSAMSESQITERVMVLAFEADAKGNRPKPTGKVAKSVAMTARAILLGKSEHFWAPKTTETSQVLSFNDTAIRWDHDKQKVIEIPYAPENRSELRFDFNWRANPQTPIWDRAVEELVCGDRELVKQLETWIGTALLTGGRGVSKVLYMMGGTGSGKSTISEFIMSLWGKDRSSNVHTSNWHDSKMIATFATSKINVATEVGKLDSVSSEKIKGITNCSDSITVRRCYEHPSTFKPDCAHIWTGNDRPHLKDYSGAIWERLSIVPCDRNSRRGKGEDKFFAEKLVPERGAIVARCIRVAAANGCEIVTAPASSALLYEIATEADAFLSWLRQDDINVTVPDDEHADSFPKEAFATSMNDAYADFTRWCRENNRGLRAHSTECAIARKAFPRQFKNRVARRKCKGAAHLALMIPERDQAAW